MDKKALVNLIDVAAGRKKADIVLKNGKIVDVYQQKIMDGDVAIVDGKIAGVGEEYDGVKVIDVDGQYITPGLIDPHMHVESSYVTPEEFGRLLTPLGTTTVMADPHEIVNVKGLPALDYMIEAAKQTALDIQYMMPSCVPATNMENAGAIVTAKDMEAPLKDGQTAGLAEFMDFPGVIHADDGVMDKIITAKNLDKRIDGHAPMVSGKSLNAYIAAGIENDHECSTVAELEERIRLGMYVFLREGSVTQNVRTLLKGVTPENTRRCVLSGDDVQAKTMLEKGHLDHAIRICVEEGIPALQAIQMATLNAAECCELKDRGAIAPGLRADILVVRNLEAFDVTKTYIEGQLVAEDGEYNLPIEKADSSSMENSVHLKGFSIERLALPLTSNKARAIEVMQTEVLTNEAIVDVVRDDAGNFVYQADKDVTKIAIVERHQLTGNVFVGLLKDYGIKQGAIAISIAHDSHNLVVTGTNDDDMAIAIETLQAQDGGVVLIHDGKVIESMPLKVAGLMSTASGREVTEQLQKVNKAAYDVLGISTEVNPIMTLSFMSLSVIPTLKITDLGLVHVNEGVFTSVSVE